MGIEALGAQSQLAAELGKEGGIPLLGGEVASAKLLQVQEYGADALRAQLGNGADAEGGLAHLAGVEHVAVLSRYRDRPWCPPNAGREGTRPLRWPAPPSQHC